MKHCCLDLEYVLDNGDELGYHSATRGYCLHFTSNKSGHSGKTIGYCPWCGVKLPSDLGNLWFKVLREEHGIEDPTVYDKDKVPPEFHTDEWWKKRGL